MLTLAWTDGWQDAAACLVAGGRVLCAGEEGRFAKVRRGVRGANDCDREVPYRAMAWCLKSRSLRLSDVTHLAPVTPTVPRAARPLPVKSGRGGALKRAQTPRDVPAWPPHALSYASLLASSDCPDGLPDILDHARHAVWQPVAAAHALLAGPYLTSPFDEAAILVLGSGANGYRCGFGRDGVVHALSDGPSGAMLAILPAWLLTYLGYRPGLDDGQVAALAAHGTSRLRAALDTLATREPGQAAHAAASLLGPKRAPHAPLHARHYDIACAYQEVLNETAIAIGQWLKARTAARALVVSGPLARNCVLTSAIREAGVFDAVWTHPAPTGASLALGAALLAAPEEGVAVRAALTHTGLGPEFSEEQMETCLQRARVRYGRPPAIAVAVAARLAQDKVIAWFQGGLELGPRALSNRVVLASPIHGDAKARLNRLKGRPAFQPLACAAPCASAGDWVEDEPSPFATVLARVRASKRPRIPAAVHIDGSACLQVVERAVSPAFHDVIEAFGAMTGVPLLVRIPFTGHARAWVVDPCDALAAYASSDIDALALGPFLLEKSPTA